MGPYQIKKPCTAEEAGSKVLSWSLMLWYLNDALSLLQMTIMRSTSPERSECIYAEWKLPALAHKGSSQFDSYSLSCVIVCPLSPFTLFLGESFSLGFSEHCLMPLPPYSTPYLPTPICFWFMYFHTTFPLVIEIIISLISLSLTRLLSPREWARSYDLDFK